jgi:hypothetical protein
MATPLEHAQLVCGFCRVTAAELASAGYELLDEHTVIRMHVQEDHNGVPGVTAGKFTVSHNYLVIKWLR